MSTSANNSTSRLLLLLLLLLTNTELIELILILTPVCHVLMGVTIDEVWVELDLLTYLYTPLKIANNHSSIANLHTLQITTAPTKPFCHPAVYSTAVP
jgi:hypothetical protein